MYDDGDCDNDGGYKDFYFDYEGNYVDFNDHYDDENDGNCDYCRNENGDFEGDDMAMMTIMKAIKNKYDGSADNDVINSDPNNGNNDSGDDYHEDSDYEGIEDFVNGDNDALKMMSDDEQNRTEILFGLKHYKLIVTTIHNIQTYILRISDQPTLMRS